MKTLIISLLAIAIIAALTFGARNYLEENKPEAETKERVEMVPVVDVAIAKRQDLAFPLLSEGLVQTRRETILSAQVGGRIVEVHPQFEVGALFKKDEVIAKIDRLNYTAVLAQMKSALADAKLAVVREEARGAQAARDWKKIGGGKPATDLVLRVPFLESAKAQVISAQAALDKAEEDLKRTLIRAPFDCRVRQVTLNLGATVAPGSQLGMIYDAESLMVRLPFSLDDYSQIPEGPEVQLSTEISGQRYTWRGEVMWDLGEVDQATLSSYLLVGILPNDSAPKRFRLPSLGLFLKAEVVGASVDGVVAVPRNALRGRDQVGVLNEASELELRRLTIVRGTSDTVYASRGVQDGEKVILTKIELPVAGMKLAEPQPEGEPEPESEEE